MASQLNVGKNNDVKIILQDKNDKMENHLSSFVCLGCFSSEMPGGDCHFEKNEVKNIFSYLSVARTVVSR